MSFSKTIYQMNNEQLNYIIKHEKWRFSTSDYFDRYHIMAAPVSFLIIGISALIYGGGINKITISNLVSLFPIGIFFVGVLFFMFCYKRIESEKQFRRIELRRALSLEELKDILNEIGWSVDNANENYTVAKTDISLFSWGEEVTLIQCASYLLINSRPTGSQPFTFNRDSFNYSKLKEYLEIKLYV